MSEGVDSTLDRIMVVTEFTCDPKNFQFTDAMRQSYEEFGYFIIRGFLANDELKKLKSAVEHERFRKHGYGLNDEDDKECNLVMWRHPGNDVTGMLARCEKVAGTCEKLLGGEVYHYHTKLMTKAPKTGGKLFWHQDYGYWYKNGCLFPDLMSAFIPLDRCTKESGCLEILERSHKCGRIDHVISSNQTGADVERVEELKTSCPHKYVDMEPGDAIFFHCNVLHTSGQNVSDVKRSALIPCYNLKRNNPVYEHHHPRYTPLEKVPDTAIMTCDNFDDLSGKMFNQPLEDKTINYGNH